MGLAPIRLFFVVTAETRAGDPWRTAAGNAPSRMRSSFAPLAFGWAFRWGFQMPTA
jgi:hypothetical protein